MIERVPVRAQLLLSSHIAAHYNGVAKMRVLLNNALLAGTALLAGVFAGRFAEIAQRKGYTQQLIEDLKHQTLEALAVNASDYRFYNSKTEKYFVESLPEIPQHFMTEMYAGLMPIDMKNASRALYYVFTPTVGKPVDEVTIWLNGGPGCSSLEGFFQENGRIIWTCKEPQKNVHLLSSQSLPHFNTWFGQLRLSEPAKAHNRIASMILALPYPLPHF